MFYFKNNNQKTNKKNIFNIFEKNHVKDKTTEKTTKKFHL